MLIHQPLLSMLIQTFAIINCWTESASSPPGWKPSRSSRQHVTQRSYEQIWAASVVVNNRGTAIVTIQSFFYIEFSPRNFQLFCCSSLNPDLRILLQALLIMNLLQHRENHRKQVMEVSYLVCISCFICASLHNTISPQTSFTVTISTTYRTSLLLFELKS